MSVSVVLKDNEKVSVSISPVDAAGNPGKIDGVPVWSSSNETVLTVTPADDGLSAVLTTVGPLGNAQVEVNADADLGEGVKNVSGLIDVEVVAGETVALNPNVGTPETR